MRYVTLCCMAALVVGMSACNPRIGDSEPLTKGADLVDRGTAPLTAAEVEIFLRDSTLRHQGEKRIWHVYLAEDGRLVGHSRDPETEAVERARGTWEVKPDGQICRQWAGDWGGGTSGCAKVYRYGDDYVFAVESAEGGKTEEIRRTRLPGNPLSL